jgi:hypothetical protein
MRKNDPFTVVTWMIKTGAIPTATITMKDAHDCHKQTKTENAPTKKAITTGIINIEGIGMTTGPLEAPKAMGQVRKGPSGVYKHSNYR